MTDYRLYQVLTGNIFVTDTENKLYGRSCIYLLTLAPEPVEATSLVSGRLDRSFLSIGTTVGTGEYIVKSGSTFVHDSFSPITDRREVSEQDFFDSYNPFLLVEEAYVSSLQEIATAYYGGLKKLEREKNAQIAQLGPRPTLNDHLQAF